MNAKLLMCVLYLKYKIQLNVFCIWNILWIKYFVFLFEVIL